MKKNLFFVFTMLCALSFFTACSDDDDNKTDDGWKAISATYTAETLKLTMGGTEVADQSVKVDASSAEQATITLANLIPGVFISDNGIGIYTLRICHSVFDKGFTGEKQHTAIPSQPGLGCI